MDVLLNIVSKYNFVRLSSKLDFPIVFHCVPGAGKSTCIRELIRADSRFEAYTLGVGDPPALSGVGIRKFAGEVSAGYFSILDEYNLEEAPLEKFYAVFGDPIQAEPKYTLRANFICKLSKRFGSCTAQLLGDLGYEVLAEGDDIVQIKGIYDIDPQDVIIYYEEDVGCFLRRHNLEAKHIKEAIGQTFRHVTFVTAESVIPQDKRAVVFQCLTRHSESLLIMCPNGSFSAS